MQLVLHFIFSLMLFGNLSSYTKSMFDKPILPLAPIEMKQQGFLVDGSSSCNKKRKKLVVKQPKVLKVDWIYSAKFQPKPEEAWQLNLSIPNDGDLELNLLSEKLELLQVRKIELKKGKHTIKITPIITTPAEEAYALELQQKFGNDFQLNSTFNGLTYLYPGNFALQVKFQNQVETLSLELVANN